jgi:uncharacterized membrane protein (DUF2068 family)
MPDAGHVANSSGLAATQGRSFGLVFTVFYWVIGGVGAMVVGLLMAAASGVGQQFVEDMRGRANSPTLPSAIEMIVYETLGVGLFLYGLLLLVASYGLWTFRKWGLAWAKSLAVVSIVLNLLALIAAFASRAGIINALAGATISILILVYLFGRSELSGRLQQFASRMRPSGEPDWSEFK